METIAILLLLGALGLGCVVFYVFLQFLQTGRQAEERQKLLLEKLTEIEKRLPASTPGSTPPGPCRN